jgi:hypothetical protein
VLPLFARLSAADQQRVFSGSTGRRIVLATNVAETSLTVPGIRYVIDTGTARVKRYRYRSKVEQLQIEPILRPPPTSARAAAAGSPTASASGCIPRPTSRNRVRFTDPEVLRSSLAGGHPADEGPAARPRSKTSRSSIRRPARRSPTATRCCTSSTPSTSQTSSPTRPPTGAPAASIRTSAACCWPRATGTACARC